MFPTQPLTNFTLSLAWTSATVLPYFAFAAVTTMQLQFNTNVLLSTDLLHYRDVDVAAQLPKRLLVPLNSHILWNGQDGLLVDITVSGGVRPVVCRVVNSRDAKVLSAFFTFRLIGYCCADCRRGFIGHSIEQQCSMFGFERISVWQTAICCDLNHADGFTSRFSYASKTPISNLRLITAFVFLNYILFIVDPPPQNLSVWPHIGVASGGTRVTITGAFLGRNHDDVVTNGATVGFGITIAITNLLCSVLYMCLTHSVVYQEMLARFG